MIKSKHLSIGHAKLRHLKLRHLTLNPSDEDTADYSFTKVPNKSAVYVGKPITYILRFTNNTDTDVTNVVISDGPDAKVSLTVGSVTITNGVGIVTKGNTGGDTTVEVTFPTVAAGEFVRITFEVVVNSEGSGSIVNQAQVDSDQFVPFPSNQALVTVTQPLLSLASAVSQSVLFNNDLDTALVTVTVDNTGSGAGEVIQVTDPVHAELNLVPGSPMIDRGESVIEGPPIVWDIASLAASDAGNLTYSVTANSLTAASVQASLTADNHGNVTGNLVNITKSPVPMITQISGKAEITANEIAHIIVTIDNTACTKPVAHGTYLATFNPRLNVVPGTVTTTQGSVTSDINQVQVDVFGVLDTVVTIEYDVRAALATVGNGRITGRFTADGLDETKVTDISVVHPYLDTSYLTIEGNPALVIRGSTIKFIAEIINNGSGAATGVIFNDLISDPYLTLVVGSVIPDQGTVIKGNTGGDTTVEIDLGTVVVGTINVEYQVLIDGLTPHLTNVYSRYKLTPDNDIAYTTPDKGVLVIEAPDVVSVMSTLEAEQAPGYYVTVNNVVTNHGGLATNVVYTDTISAVSVVIDVGSVSSNPKGTIIEGNTGGDTQVVVDIGQLSKDESVTIQYLVQIEDPYTPGVPGSFNLQSVVTGDNFADQNSNIVTVNVEEPEQHTFTKSSLNGLLGIPGTVFNIHIDFDVSATGTHARDVVVVDTIQQGLALVVGSVISSQGTVLEGNSGGDVNVIVDLGRINRNHGADVDFDVTAVAPPPALPALVPNYADVSGSNFPDDQTTTINFSIVEPQPSLSGTKNTDKDTYEEGETIHYTLVISAGGTADAEDVIFTDDIDAPGANLVVGSVVVTGQGTVTSGNTGGDTQVVVDIGLFTIGSSTTIEFDVLIDNPFGPGVPGNVINFGTLSGSNFTDTNTEIKSVNVIADQSPTWSFIKAYDESAQIIEPGDVLNFDLTLNNIGNVEATNTIVEDLLADTNLTLVVGSVTTTHGTVTTGNTGGDTTIVVDVGTVAVAQQTTIEYQVTVNPAMSTPGSVSNFGTIKCTELNDQNSNILNINVEAPDISLVKSSDKDPVNAGETIQFTLFVTNDGGADATNLSVTDLITESRYSLVVGSVVAPGGSVITGNTGGDTTIRVDYGTLLKSGNSYTITFDCVVGALSASGTGSNTAQVSGDNFTTVNSNTLNVTITSPTIAFTKSAVQSTVNPGASIDYQLVANNTGDGVANNLQVTELFGDANLSLVEGSVSADQGATITLGNGGGDTTIQVDLVSLAASNSLTITFQGITNGAMLIPGSVANTGNVSGDNVAADVSNTVNVTVNVAQPIHFWDVLETDTVNVTGTDVDSWEDSLNPGTFLSGGTD